MSAIGSGTAAAVLEGARARLLGDGYAALSMRKVASEAGVPLSLVHYHFGSKSGLVLALLKAEDARRLARQVAMYGEETPLWQRYDQACDFLEDDLDTGYVRLVQELIAAGWSNPDLAEAARAMVQAWFALLADVADEAATRLGGLGPFNSAEIATLVGAVFAGAESMLLLGLESPTIPLRAALRRFGQVIRHYEEQASQETP